MDELIAAKKWIELVQFLAKQRKTIQNETESYEFVWKTVEKAHTLSCARSASILYFSAYSVSDKASNYARCMDRKSFQRPLSQICCFAATKSCLPLFSPIFTKAWPQVEGLWKSEPDQTPAVRIKKLVQAIFGTISALWKEWTAWRQIWETPLSLDANLTAARLPERRWTDALPYTPRSSQVFDARNQPPAVTFTDYDELQAQVFGTKPSALSSVPFQAFYYNDPEVKEDVEKAKKQDEDEQNKAREAPDQMEVDGGSEFNPYGNSSDRPSSPNLSIMDTIVEDEKNDEEEEEKKEERERKEEVKPNPFTMVVDNEYLTEEHMAKMLTHPLVSSLPDATLELPVALGAKQHSMFETQCHFASLREFNCARLLLDPKHLAAAIQEQWQQACQERACFSVKKFAHVENTLPSVTEFLREWEFADMPISTVFPSTIFGVIIVAEMGGKLTQRRLSYWDLRMVSPHHRSETFGKILGELSELLPQLQDVRQLDRPFHHARFPRSFSPVDPTSISRISYEKYCQSISRYVFLVPRSPHVLKRVTDITPDVILRLCQPVAETGDMFIFSRDKVQACDRKRRIAGCAFWQDVIVQDVLPDFSAIELRQMAMAADISYYQLTNKLGLFPCEARQNIWNQLHERGWDIANKNAWIIYEFHGTSPTPTLPLAPASEFVQRDHLFSRYQAQQPFVYQYYNDTRIHEWGPHLQIKALDDTDQGWQVEKCELPHAAVVDFDTWSISIKSLTVGQTLKRNLVLLGSMAWQESVVATTLNKFASLVRKQLAAAHTLVFDATFKNEHLMILCCP